MFVELIDVIKPTGDGGVSHSDDVEECIDKYFDETIKVRKFPGMHVLHLHITGAKFNIKREYVLFYKGLFLFT